MCQAYWLTMDWIERVNIYSHRDQITSDTSPARSHFEMNKNTFLPRQMENPTTSTWRRVPLTSFWKKFEILERFGRFEPCIAAEGRRGVAKGTRQSKSRKKKSTHYTRRHFAYAWGWPIYFWTSRNIAVKSRYPRVSTLQLNWRCPRLGARKTRPTQFRHSTTSICVVCRPWLKKEVGYTIGRAQTSLIC